MTQSSTLPGPATLVIKTAQQVHDDYIRTIKNGLISIGILNPNVGPGSDYDLQGWGIAYAIAPVHANTAIANNNVMPDTAGGTFLDRWLAVLNLTRNGATQATGVIAPQFQIVSGYVNVQATQQLTDSGGQLYQVTVGGQYGPGGAGQPAQLYVPVISVSGGSATNHANGDPLQWVIAPPFTAQQATVGTTGGSDGLSGGADSEVDNDEPPRARMLSVFQNPPKGGNWSQVAQWCQQSTPDVEAGFVYPALLGPATVFACVTRAAQKQGVLSSTSKNRDFTADNAQIVNGVVLPYVAGLLPSNMFLCITQALNQPADVALLLSLPTTPTAITAGPGGGWIDGSPWPASVNGNSPVTVTSVASSSSITVNAQTPPVDGVSSVAWISPLTWQLYTATVLSHTGVAGAYALQLSAPFPGIVGGAFIFPQALQQQNYLTAALQAFANLGPGEWSSNATVLTRAFRHPTPGAAQQFPYKLDANLLRTMENAGAEVLSASFLYTSAGVAPVAPAVPVGTPTATVSGTGLGQLTSSPPSIFVPRNLAWYAA